MNENPQILITGASGLVGSRIVELLTNYNFEESIVDITDKDSIIGKIKDSNASIVLHLAAKTDVDGCEKDKGQAESGDAWKINVLGTKNIVDGCLGSRKKLIYISTDFIFDGEKKDPYMEEDLANPVNWYGRTKYEGEKLVLSSNLDFIIARIAYPYRSDFERLDFVRKFIKLISEGKSVSMVTDHVMTPTYIDDIAQALDILIRNKTTGVYHVVGSQFINPYEIGLRLADKLGISKTQIKQTTREEFFKDRAPRPFHLALKNDKIKGLGVKMRTFEEGLLEVIK